MVLRTLLLLLVLPSVACLDDIGPPDFGGPRPCNNNGQCDNGEDSVGCAADCPACQAIEVFVDGNPDANAQLALLKANDSKTISLSSNTTILIQLGQAVYHDTDSSIDFTLQGSVTSDSTVVLTSEGCVQVAPSDKAWVVRVSKDNEVGSYTDVGYFAKTVQGGPGGGATPGVATFSLCGFGQDYARYIQLVPLAGATGTLDYFKAHSCDP